MKINSLTLKDFVLFENQEIIFGNSLNILSGDSGSGKSLIFKALNIIFGEKFDNSFIRKNSEKSIIECSLDLNISLDNPFDLELKNNLIIRRINDGKNVINYLNDTKVTNKVLLFLREKIFQILSQNTSISLFKEQYQIDIINSFIDTDIIEKYSKIYNEHKSIKQKINQINENLKKKEDDIEYINYQLKDLNILNESDRDLAQKIENVENFKKVNEKLNTLENLTFGEELSLDSLIYELRKIKNNFSEEIKNSIDLDALISIKNNIQSAINKEKNNLERSIENIDELYERIELINKIIKKYNNNIDSALLKKKENLDKINYYENLDKELSKITKEFNLVTKKALELAKEISKKRIEVILKINKDINKIIKKLNISGSVEFVLSSKEEININGIDSLSIIFSPNKGEDKFPLEKIASGGELSRILLSIFYCIGEKNNSIILLDEVDTGISGETGFLIGELMRELSYKNQLIVISHLAQVASYSEHHYRIDKLSNDKRTYSLINICSESDKLNEIIKLSGGKIGDKKSIEHANNILKRTKKTAH